MIDLSGTIKLSKCNNILAIEHALEADVPVNYIVEWFVKDNEKAT